jgi:hypothetical protein
MLVRSLEHGDLWVLPMKAGFCDGHCAIDPPVEAHLLSVAWSFFPSGPGQKSIRNLWPGRTHYAMES